MALSVLKIRNITIMINIGGKKKKKGFSVLLVE